MHFIHVGESYRQEWENLVKSNPASGYMQSFFWAEFRALLGWDIYKIGILEENKLIGGAIVAKYAHFPYGSFLSISEGPVLPYTSPHAEYLFHTLMKEVDSVADLSGTQFSSHVSIEPKLESIPPYFSRFVKSPIDQQPMRTLLIPLQLDEESILSQMKPKGRYNIRLAEKHGVIVIQKTLPEGMNEFKVFYQEFVQRMKFEGKNDTYFDCLTEVLHRERNAYLYFAKYRSETLAAALVIDYGDTATYLFGASSTEYPSVMAPYLLHWEIIRDAKRRGRAWYDLYSLVPDPQDTRHAWYGYSQFKQKFGGVTKKYIGGYNFIYNKALYDQFLRITS